MDFNQRNGGRKTEEQLSTRGKFTEPESSELIDCLISNKVPDNWTQSVHLVLKMFTSSSLFFKQITAQQMHHGFPN